MSHAVVFTSVFGIRGRGLLAKAGGRCGGPRRAPSVPVHELARSSVSEPTDRDG
jgi:hypothetical protein